MRTSLLLISLPVSLLFTVNAQAGELTGWARTLLEILRYAPY